MAGLDDASDALLAERAADGDERAFAVIVRRHAPYLRAFALRLGGSGVDADDAVQEGLIIAWQKLPTLSDPERLRSWLSTIVSRRVTDRARSRRDADPIDGEEPAATSASPEARAETSSQLDALGGVLAALPEEQRQVWVLKEVGGFSYEEIAERTETSTSTVRGRLARARATVLEQMSGWR